MKYSIGYTSYLFLTITARSKTESETYYGELNCSTVSQSAQSVEFNQHFPGVLTGE